MTTLPHDSHDSRTPAPRRTTVIVGGVAGGMSTATRLRRLDEHREIIVFERSSAVSFANCGLPYHVSGVIADRADLELQTPERLAARFRIDARVRHDVVAIDREAKTVTVESDAGTEAVAYDELVLSPGAAPRTLERVTDDAPVYSLRTLDDLDAIMEALASATAPSRAVVIGGGYIGIEMADNLHRRGIRTTIVQSAGRLLPALDPEMAAPLAAHVLDQGVDVRLERRARAVTREHVELDSGETIDADLVIAALGVRPESTLATASGLTLGESGGIRVDARHRTNDPAIFAIGDVAEKADAIDGQPRPVALAGLANRHGRQVADTIAGAASTPTDAAPAIGTAIVDVLGLTAASTGWNEQTAVSRGRAVRVLHAHPVSHAGYFPGAAAMSLKLVIDRDTDRILGAQAVGTEGIARRIDVIATAMSAGLTASALADLELAYAPQYGSAKDPVNMLGYLARNRAHDDRTIQWHALAGELAAGALLLDVRAEAQLVEGTIPGAAWVPVEDLRARHHEFDGRRIVVHCRVGQGAHTATSLLTNLGHDVVNLDGGYLTWRDGTLASNLTKGA